MQHTIQPHNPAYKLIEQVYSTDNGYATLVYGEANDGTNKGLEVYFHKDGKITHYNSRRWLLDKVPAKYQDAVLQLRLWLPRCPAGHKLILA